MGSTAFVFPGQGSQYVGMGKDLFLDDPLVRSLYEEADRVLGIPLSTLSFEGPEETLRRTENTQPAIFVHSVAVAGRLRQRPDMVAGHSLGEYSALVAAESIAFPDALRLVRLRGCLMQKAGEERRGTMAAIVGLSPDTVEEICREASAGEIAVPANFNSPGQIAVSGSEEGVRRAMELARQRGAKLVKELVVSGAFHSPLMESARNGLKMAIDQAAIRDAAVPVYANVTAEPVTSATAIRDLLYRQLTSPVRWEETLIHMARDGATVFIEVGPGKVLQGLVKRTLKGVETKGYGTLDDLRQS